MSTKPSPSRTRPGRVPAVTKRTARKAATHARILTSAGQLARREGLAAASVPRVMAGADLTIGGFYAHFSSKEAMDAELIRCVLGDLPGRWLAGLEESSGLDWLAKAVKRYLDRSHRDNPDGCAYPAVISEVIRSGDNVRRAFAESFDRRVRAFSAHAPDSPTISKRDRALATLALTLGALVLARATRGAAISDEVLVASRKWALPEENERASGQRSGRARRRSR